MAEGFIRDKLEIKFVILYVMSRVTAPIPMDGVQQLTMIDGGIEYFDFAECLNDLVRTEHLTLHDGLYLITAKGVRNSQICESNIPYSVRLKADKELAAYNAMLLRKSQVRSGVTANEKGGYTVDLALDDDLGSVMRLSLMIPDEAMGKELSDRFQRDPEKMYSKILEAVISK